MGLRRKFRVKNTTFVYTHFFGIFLLLFIKKNYVLSFSVLFLWTIKLPQQNINQSEIGIGDEKLSVELYAE